MVAYCLACNGSHGELRTGLDHRLLNLVLATIPEVPGAISQGRTREEARTNVIDALRVVLTPDEQLAGKPVDAEQLVRLSNVLSRVLAQVGDRAKPRNATPSLAEYLRKTHEAAE